MKHKSKVTAACGCQSCVNSAKEKIFTIYEDKIVYFCNNNCVVEFSESPEKFLQSDHFKIPFESLDNYQLESEDLSLNVINANQ